MKVEYSSNNSGGDWWLKDKDWLALEKAGWEVIWGNRWFCKSKYAGLFGQKRPAYLKRECKEEGKCPGHKAFRSLKEMTKEDYWLGSPAQYATKDFPSLREAIAEWEEVTGLAASEVGCGCCGPPHSFSMKGGGYASGEECARVLYDDHSSYRELLAEKAGRRKR